MARRSSVEHRGRSMETVSGNGRHESMALTAHVASARCLARTIAIAFDACEDADVPLSELQRVAIVEAALLEFDGFGAHLATLSSVGSLLHDLGAV